MQFFERTGLTLLMPRFGPTRNRIIERQLARRPAAKRRGRPPPLVAAPVMAEASAAGDAARPGFPGTPGWVRQGSPAF
jgi:hypothetical protein